MCILLLGVCSKLPPRVGNISHCKSSCIRSWLIEACGEEVMLCLLQGLQEGERKAEGEGNEQQSWDGQGTELVGHGFQGTGLFVLAGQKHPNHYPGFNFIYGAFSIPKTIITYFTLCFFAGTICIYLKYKQNFFSKVNPKRRNIGFVYLFRCFVLFLWTSMCTSTFY